MLMWNLLKFIPLIGLSHRCLKVSVLQVKNLHKAYKRGFIPRLHPVLKGVHFSIEKGVMTGFLGGNGAGKTTTLKCLLGLVYPDKGRVEFLMGIL